MADTPGSAASPELEAIGRRLRAAREVRGVTLEAVEAGTHIRKRYLEAIEAGRARDIPGDVFLKGFLRSYADHLGLDGAAMVEDYKRASADVQRLQAEQDAERPRRRRRLAPGGPDKAASAARSPMAALATPVAMVLAVLALAFAAHALIPGGRHVAPAARRTPDATGRSPRASASTPGAFPASPSQDTSGTTPAGGSSSGTTAPGPVSAVRVRTSFTHTNLGWQGTYQVSGTRALSVTIRIGNSECWVRHWVDGVLQPDVFLQPGTTTTWTARQSLRLLVGRVPAIVSIVVDGYQTQALPIEGNNPETLTFEMSPGTFVGGAATSGLP